MMHYLPTLDNVSYVNQSGKRPFFQPLPSPRVLAGTPRVKIRSGSSIENDALVAAHHARAHQARRGLDDAMAAVPHGLRGHRRRRFAANGFERRRGRRDQGFHWPRREPASSPAAPAATSARAARIALARRASPRSNRSHASACAAASHTRRLTEGFATLASPARCSAVALALLPGRLGLGPALAQACGAGLGAAGRRE